MSQSVYNFYSDNNTTDTMNLYQCARFAERKMFSSIKITLQFINTLNTCKVESKQTQEHFPLSIDLYVQNVICLLPPDRTWGSSNLLFNAYRGAAAGA
jgi:hypothetical protein